MHSLSLRGRLLRAAKTRSGGFGGYRTVAETFSGNQKLLGLREKGIYSSYTRTHTFDFMLTAACCSSGGGSYSFSAVSPASVPERGVLALLSLGLAGIGAARRRKA